MEHRLEIALLGGLTIRKDGEPVAGLASRKAEALFAYLAYTGKPHARETLADLLWDDRPQAQALANLRALLSNLRKRLEAYILITRHTAAINPESNVQLDTARFVAHIAVARKQKSGGGALPEAAIERLQQAVTLYRGDFLIGFHVRESRGLEEWALVERERLRRLVVEALHDIVAHELTVGAYGAGIEYAARQLELDPLREAAHRQLMLLLARSGQRNAALAQYETCRATLQAELGVEPQPETTALYERIRSAVAAPDLPPDPTPFIGREAELAQLRERLANPACRLLTLVGAGGIGKTRLALQAARQKAGAFLHGVYYVPLAPVSAAEFIVPAIADALNFSFDGETNPEAQLLDYLREKEALLLLDNFEHLLTPLSSPPPAGGMKRGVDLLAEILLSAPLVKLLVTSRERLNLQEEWLFETPGLRAPLEATAETAVAPEAYSAVQLFIQSARRTYSDFSPTKADYPHIGRICRLLGGTPLAVELAAAWVRLFSCEEILAEIEADLDFLATPLRNVPERHQSMRAVFRHSWSLLSEGEKAAVRKLSIFRGPFGRAAAQAVADARPAILLSLVDKSFLSQRAAGQYELHELLKQYAAEELAANPEEREAAEALHGSYYAGFLHRREQTLKGWGQQAALAEIGAQIENIRAAWAWAVARADLPAITQAMEGLYLFYWARNWMQEGREAFAAAAAAARAAADDLLQARIWVRQAEFHAWLSQYEAAKTLLDRSIEICRAQRAQGELAPALDLLGRIAYWLGNYADAREHFQESLIIYRQLEDQYGMCLALSNLASTLCDESADYDRAQPLYEESLALARQIGDRYGEARALVNQGTIAQGRKDYAQATQLFKQSLDIYREIEYRHGVSAALNYLGQTAVLAGEYMKAEALLQESLDLNRSVGNRRAIADSLQQLGDLACKTDALQEARRRYSEALRLAMEIQALPLTLEVITSVAKLYSGEEKSARAVELLTFVLHQTEGGQEIKNHAGELLAKLEAGLQPEVAARCRARGRERKLADVVAEILGD